MNYATQEWLNLIFRWIHVFAGILWVGATYYFTWLDRRFHTTDPDQVWMVHSGGFYVVGKEKKPSPAHTLHWFRWEAAITWVSGLLLLVIVYYMGGLLVDGEPGKPSFAVAAMWGIGSMIVGWIVIPVVLIMISSHVPNATFGHQYNWSMLAIFTLVGWGVAHVIRKH